MVRIKMATSKPQIVSLPVLIVFCKWSNYVDEMLGCNVLIQTIVIFTRWMTFSKPWPRVAKPWHLAFASNVASFIL